MNNINNIKITYNAIYALGMLAVLAFGLIILPTKAGATPGYVDGYSSTVWPNYTNTVAQNNSGNTVNTTPSNNYNPSTINQSNSNPNQTTSVTTSTSTDSSNISSTSTENSEATASESNESYGDLASNAVFGSSGIYPSGVIQWVFFGILVLMIVILVRKIFGFEEKYDSTPMKHA